MATKNTKPAPPTPTRTARPKAEVQKEFTQIQSEAATARESPDPKADELARRQADEVRTAVDGVSAESILQRTSALTVELSQSLTDVADKLVREVNLLATVRQAVVLERQELERMHKIDVAATALDQMVQDHERENERLAGEIASQRAAWEEESRTVERDRKEQEESLRKARQRETEEYEYKKTLERKRAQDKYDEETKLQERRNREKQEALERSWREREEALQAQEQDASQLRQQSNEFPARLAREVEQARGEAGRVAELKYEQQIVLQQKDAETERRVAALRIQALEESLARQAEQMVSLQRQLEEAKQQVQEIAVRAIEGASGSRALAHVNQIAMEQAKTRNPQG